MGAPRRILDVVGCAVFAIAYAYLCCAAPLAIIPVVALLSGPLALVGLPFVVVGMLMLTGFGRGARRTIEGGAGLLVAGLVLVGACVVSFGQTADPRLLRAMVHGASFPWGRMVVPIFLSIVAAAAAAVALFRSRRIRWWSAGLAGLLLATLPVVMGRGLVFFVVLLRLPYTA